MLEIRPATLSDTAEIVALEMTIIDQMALSMVARLGRDNIEDALREAALQDADARYNYRHAMVATLGSKVVGVAFGYPSEQEPRLDTSLQALLYERFGENDILFADSEVYGDEWYLDSISVAESARGRGVGSALLAALPAVAWHHGKQVIGLNVDDANPKARALYERQGFYEVARITIGAHAYTHMYWDVAK